MVVGVAGWPWVRASMGTERYCRASVATCSASSVAAGSHTSRTARCTSRA